MHAKLREAILAWVYRAPDGLGLVGVSSYLPVIKVLLRRHLSGARRDIDAVVRSIEHLESLRCGLQRIQDAFQHRGESYALDSLIAAVERSRQTLDRSDTAALSSLETYALILINRGDLRRAVAANRKVAAAYSQILGPLDPAALRTRYRDTLLTWRSGEPQAAQHAAERLLEDCGTLEPCDPIRLSVMAGLALILADAGELARARALQLTCVDERARCLGDEHLATLRARIDLFMTLVQLGERANARALLDRITATRGASARFRHGIREFDVGALLAMNASEYRAVQALEAMFTTGEVPSRRTFHQNTNFEL